MLFAMKNNKIRFAKKLIKNLNLDEILYTHDNTSNKKLMNYLNIQKSKIPN